LEDDIMKQNRIGLSILALTLVAVACANPAKDQPKATVGAAVAVQAAPAAATLPTLYAIAPATSKIQWTGSKVTGKHEGSFSQFTGSVNITDGKLDNARIEITIDMASLAVEPEKLAGHLKSPDFFDVAQFPKATFTSTGIAPADQPSTYTITGNLTMHGVTKSITFPSYVVLTDKDLKASTMFSINRKDFGLVYPGMPDDLIRDEVLIRLTIVAPKGA
jgi:polyisoprenoid-binding protein YceI